MSDQISPITDVTVVKAKLLDKKNGAVMHVGEAMGWRVSRELDGLPDLEFIVVARDPKDLQAVREFLPNYKHNHPRFPTKNYAVAVVQYKDLDIKDIRFVDAPKPPEEDW